MLRTSVLPEMEAALEATRYAFERGRYSYLEWADAQRELVDVQRSLIDSSANAHLYRAEIERLTRAARAAASAGLEVHAGHGLTFNTVAPLARMPEVVELNIGHFLIGEAIFGGLNAAVRRMRALMDEARHKVADRVSA